MNATVTRAIVRRVPRLGASVQGWCWGPGYGQRGLADGLVRVDGMTGATGRQVRECSRPAGARGMPCTCVFSANRLRLGWVLLVQVSRSVLVLPLCVSR